MREISGPFLVKSQRVLPVDLDLSRHFLLSRLVVAWWSPCYVLRPHSFLVSGEELGLFDLQLGSWQDCAGVCKAFHLVKI
jgi:hypothetical protein